MVMQQLNTPAKEKPFTLMEDSGYSTMTAQAAQDTAPQPMVSHGHLLHHSHPEPAAQDGDLQLPLMGLACITFLAQEQTAIPYIIGVDCQTLMEQ